MPNFSRDYTHSYRSDLGALTQCRVRIFIPDEERDTTVVIVSENPDNPGPSITNAAEHLAGDVLHLRGLEVPLIWIEHHPPEVTDGSRETFDQVLLSSYEVEDLGRHMGEERNWKRLDRAAVEDLVGRSL